MSLFTLYIFDNKFNNKSLYVYIERKRIEQNIIQEKIYGESKYTNDPKLQHNNISF